MAVTSCNILVYHKVYMDYNHILKGLWALHFTFTSLLIQCAEN